MENTSCWINEARVYISVSMRILPVEPCYIIALQI